MATYTYLNGHINGVRPYFFMYNGQRYNAAHFNERIVFGITEEVEPTVPPTPTVEPFFVQNITEENETLIIKKISPTSASPTLTIYGSTDGVSYTKLGQTSTNGVTRIIAPGEKYYIKATGSPWGKMKAVVNYNSIQGVSKIGGDILKLGYIDGTSDLSSYAYALAGAFAHNPNLIDASELIFPDYTATGCYYSMFYGCTNLKYAPTLPATGVHDSCYKRMFYGCTSLTTAPALPATRTYQYCYESMFQGCTSLTTPPTLRATNIANDAYKNMFYNCSKLKYIRCYAIDNIDSGNTEDWLNGVYPTGDFYKPYATHTWVSGSSGIPSGWTVHNV